MAADCPQGLIVAADDPCGQLHGPRRLSAFVANVHRYDSGNVVAYVPNRPSSHSILQRVAVSFAKVMRLALSAALNRNIQFL